MLNDIKVQDCMTHPAITVDPTAFIQMAQRIMHDYHIRHLPVVKENHLVGMLSSGDIRRAHPSNATSLSVWEIHSLWEQVTVEKAMRSCVISIKPETPLLEAVRLMIEHHFNSLPVVDSTGRVLGILTEVDVFHQLLQASEPVANTFALA